MNHFQLSIINSPLLPSGYKLTEVGVIPEDWNVKKVGNVAPLQRGFDLPTPQLKSGSYPVVYSNGVLNYHNKAMAKAPGVVTGRSGTIGKVNYIEDDYWPHNTTLWVTDFKGNNPKYIYYLIHL
jgi:type I restriction enzyme, S subunit